MRIKSYERTVVFREDSHILLRAETTKSPQVILLDIFLDNFVKTSQPIFCYQFDKFSR